MPKKLVVSICLWLVASGLSAQQFTVVPVVAWGALGAAGNRWSTEVYVSNPTAQVQQVLVAGTQVLRMKEGPHPCLPPITPIQVAPYQTRVILASDLNLWLGCPEEFVGGLLLEHGEGMLVTSRMTNAKGFQAEPGSYLLQGFSQEIPGVALTQLVGEPGATYMIPALVWHPHPCTATEYDTYVYVNNSGQTDVTVRLLPREGEELTLRLGGVERQLPYLFKVPAGRVVQLAVQPLGNPDGECGQPQVFDLFFEADGKVAVLASVVDRASNDARTVLVSPANQLRTP